MNTPVDAVMQRLQAIHPRDMVGLKKLARQYTNKCGMPHHTSLEVAAKQCGFENFRHAQKEMQA